MTFFQKLRLRRSVLAAVERPIVLEAYGGSGKLWQQVYSHLPEGIVFEKDPRKIDILVQQRPTWSVYEGDCIPALATGIGRHLPVNLLDVDPYGSPWLAIEGFLTSRRPMPDVLHIVVNDGSRHQLEVTGGWTTKVLQPLIDTFGNGLRDHYLECCQLLMAERAEQAGYQLRHWHGYYCGNGQKMTHYWAVLER